MIPKDATSTFGSTLLSGGYNLLLGSGVCLDSTNGLGEQLRSAEKLRQDLCSLKKVKENTSLTRVSALLTPEERQEQLAKRFTNCKPGHSLSNLPHFLWKRLFTFNIDDVLENLFHHATHPKQKLVSINFDSSFEPAPDRRELQAVHLHGWVGKPDSSFVFSHAEYARVMREINPWMHMLAEILPTEPFIIAGTSLNEVDLEYYLSHRNEATPRRGKGPSILLEPYADAATESDCQRYGLILIKATFGEFCDWLLREFPSPPTLSDLIVPDIAGLFPKKSIAPKLLPFFADFKLIKAGDKPRSTVPSAFLYGREPSQDDLDEHLDISRQDNENILQDTNEILSNCKNPNKAKIVITLNEAGTGKTTAIMRVASELVRLGCPVLGVHTLSRIDVTNAIECIARAAMPMVLIVDRFADHIDQIVEILEDSRTLGKVVVLAAERAYRGEYIDVVLGKRPFIKRFFDDLTQKELVQLIELFREYGLIGTKEGVHNPITFARKLAGEPVAIAVCRILNDFRPLEKIVDSLWRETPTSHHLSYLCAALAVHCHPAGIRYSVLQKIAGQDLPLSSFFSNTMPLGLTENIESEEFILPLNMVYADRILHHAVTRYPAELFNAFRHIASALAPYVNRNAVKMRTPEARLAGRLLDADKIVKPLLGSRANELYEICHKDWKWNSRYWEQRALLVAKEDIGTALQYARHAVAIEVHPYTLTTLGKLLFQQMEQLNQSTESYVFAEAFERLTKAIEMEGYKSRITIHPFSTLLHGSVRFIELGGRLNQIQQKKLTDHMADAEYYFGDDSQVQQWLRRLDKLLK